MRETEGCRAGTGTWTRRGAGWAASVLAVWLVGAPAPAHSGVIGDWHAHAADQTVLADVIEVQVLDRDILAHDGNGAGTLALRLELGEHVLWSGSRGRVGVVLTNRRMLAVSSGTGSWREARYRLSEIVPEVALVEGRVALVLTQQRALGFDGRSGTFRDVSLGLYERVEAVRVSQGTALVVTDRRALALSPDAGGFFEAGLRLHEDLESAVAGSNLATVTTSQRVLVFRGPRGTWEASQREIR